MSKVTKALFALILSCMAVFAWAQQRSITGTVQSSGGPLVGATVNVKGTTRSTSTDENGRFTISAQNGDVLSISYIGYTSMEIRVADGTSFNISLAQEEDAMEEVVVAMDIKRKPRELGYSTQSVKGAEIQQTQRENFVNSLQGRVAGLTINQTSGIAGASSQIVLRGFNSLSLNNQPLFVVDGVIIDNNTIDENSGGGSGIGLASDRPNRNNDYANRISDINPNDIENITVLKGPEATALYGSQASSGAVIITTKKAKTNELAVQYDNSFRMSKVTRLQDTYNEYSNGTNGAPSAILRYFGPKYAEDAPRYDNIGNFFRTGFSQTHNLGADFGYGKSIFRVSGSYFNQNGVVPANDFKRYNLRISNTTKIGKKIELIPSLAYARSENDKVLRSAGGYLLSLYAWPVTNDINRYQDEDGNKLPLLATIAGTGEIDNPFFNVYKNNSRDVTDRLTATMGINYNPFDWLSVSGRFGYDTYKTEGYTRYHPLSYFLSAATRGNQDNFYRRYEGYNHTITATARKKVGDFTLRAMAGTMWQDYQTRMFAVAGSRLVDSIVNGIMYKGGTIITDANYNELIGLPSDSNATNPTTRTRLLQNNFGKYNQQILRQLAYFGEVSVGYKNLAFLNYTHRFETASTLPKKNRNYNYPGVSLSLIMSDIFPVLKQGPVMNYFKLRGSVASTARLNTPYSTQSVFVNNFASGGGYSYGFTNANPDLKPETQSTFEIGSEFKLWNNRITLEGTYYNTLNKGQIVENFRLSYGTGFVLNTQNAASTRNQGIEIMLDANVVKSSKFGWNLMLNFNKMYNKVVKMPAMVKEFYISDTWLYGNARGGLVMNGPTTSITSYGYKRNNAGQILINPLTGLPVNDPTFLVRGDRNPDFTLGINNRFTYGNLELKILFDLKVGGDIFNATKMYLTSIGKSMVTADRYTPRIIEGVLNDGLQDTENPTPNTISVIPAYNDAYYTSTSMPEEAFMEKDVNWLRLRDVTLSYVFPRRIYSKLKSVKTISAFVTGNDLLLFTNYSDGDPSVSGNTAGSRGVGGFGFDYGTLPPPISVNIGFRVGF
ncbi:SusC/RagA family TonB-linked outer membrane protein [Flavihumibacter stibioxidans]|uniref:SusC/RagA family TonB-linked outer membrane protein n=1 Tax=Flavihumibacter stibioxidans TaxID=1834163 RepID=A0ABR7M410_9BACT|nr:SusC/RagA family TonB-linked outer membrane protein [Flavihumibacter stibioxidans]MBC6489584.1 hypothetical protein [Flavihumibacter stibioxidans]